MSDFDFKQILESDQFGQEIVKAFEALQAEIDELKSLKKTIEALRLEVNALRQEKGKDGKISK